jgi:tetratricopeptide (TPR) repeat protein
MRVKKAHLKKAVAPALGLLVFIFLSLNIYFSQAIPDLYQKVVDNEKSAIVAYLRAIKPLPEFKSELSKYQVSYGDNITQSVFKEDYERQREIEKMEKLLARNSQARDVLYNLAILYKEKGDNQKAEEYLDRAKAIDPSLGN